MNIGALPFSHRGSEEIDLNRIYLNISVRRSSIKKKRVNWYRCSCKNIEKGRARKVYAIHHDLITKKVLYKCLLSDQKTKKDRSMYARSLADSYDMM
jgi:hypothetical protein